jgi:anti-sigma B factor antagonist
MKIVSIDPKTLAVEVAWGSEEGWQVPERLASFLMVAVECQVASITCELPDRLPPAVREACVQLMSRTPIARLVPSIVTDISHDGPGYYVVGRDEAFICARDPRNNQKYSLFIAAAEDNVDRASRCACILAVVLGFSSLVSFEVQFAVYELVMNVVEHGLEPDSNDWIHVDLERKGDRLVISIVDRGCAFDPVGDDAFDLEKYIRVGRRRGLGLIMTRRIAEQISYHRESGYNKTILKKSTTPGSAVVRARKETLMAQFEVIGPTPLGDGTHRLVLKGDLDAKGALLMEQMLAQLLEKKMFKVTLDFEKVSFISSAGVGILLGLVSSVREAGGDAIFVKITPKVISVFRLLNLEDYFTIRDSVAWGA